MSASRSKIIPLALLAALAAPSGQAFAEAAETVSENKDTDVILLEPVQDTGGMMGVRHDIGAVKAEELAPISSETVGTLSAKEGGLPVDMWKGTPREVVETFLPQLSPGPGAGTPYDLQRRLLLTVAEVPPGLPGLGERETAGLLIRRVERLYAMGDWTEARQLLDMVPEKLRAESLIRYDVESRFQEHEDKLACDRAEPYLATGDDRFWSKAGVICSLIEKDKAHANLTLDMMREEKINDPYFFAIAESLLGVKYKKLPDPDELTTLRLMLLRLSKRSAPEAVLAKTQQPAILKALALWQEFTTDVRLAAALRAEAQGALSPDEVRKLFDEQTVSDKDIADAAKAKGLRQTLLYYRAAKTNNSVDGRAEAVAKGLGAAGGGSSLLAAMRLYAPMVAEIPPGPNLTWFAPTAIRLLAASGQTEQAKAWIPFSKPQGGAENKAGEAQLLPILRLLDAVPPLEQAHLENWKDALGKDAPVNRTPMLLGLLDALGDAVPPQMLLSEAAAKADPVNIPPAVWQGLKQAAANKSVGQAVLFALLALDGTGPGETPALILQEAVRTLKAAGLAKEARALALEAAIAAGI